MATISWKSGISGDWSTAADWSGGVAPGSGDDVTVGAAGTYSVTVSVAEAAHSLLLSDATATLVDNSSLTIGSTLTVTAGTFQLNAGGTIVGGTLSSSGSGFAFDGGTLDGVTYDGTLDMSASNSSLHISGNGLIAKGAGGAGNGTISLTGSGAQLYFVNNQTLNNATIDIGSASGNYATLYDDDTTDSNHTLTLGAGLTIDQTGTYALLGDAVGFAGDGFVNQGTMKLGVSGGTFLINSNSFVSQGAITVSNGDTLTLAATAWSTDGHRYGVGRAFGQRLGAHIRSIGGGRDVRDCQRHRNLRSGGSQQQDLQT